MQSFLCIPALRNYELNIMKKELRHWRQFLPFFHWIVYRLFRAALCARRLNVAWRTVSKLFTFLIIILLHRENIQQTFVEISITGYIRCFIKNEIVFNVFSSSAWVLSRAPHMTGRMFWFAAPPSRSNKNIRIAPTHTLSHMHTHYRLDMS